MASSYEPTPLEEAYASYLLEKVFMIDKDNDVIRIPGRKAVPFLTTSGVERQILRDAWSVADPMAVGKLKSKRQFCVVLRLVALAQAGWLTSESPNLLEVLNDYKGDVSLPKFASVEIPSAPSLLRTYGIEVKAQKAPEHILSVSDAFDNLIEVEDAPLPVLSAPPEEPPDVPEEPPDVVEDEFGSFESPEAAGENNPKATPTDDDIESDFDDFVEATDVTEEPSPDLLGDFSEPNLLSEVEPDYAAPRPEDRKISEKTDLFYSTHTDFSSASQMESGGEDEDDFGDFNEAGAREGEDTDAVNAGDDDDDVFGDLKRDTNLAEEDERNETPEIQPVIEDDDGLPDSGTPDSFALTLEKDGLDTNNTEDETAGIVESGTLPSQAVDDDPFSAFDALAGPSIPVPELPPLGFPPSAPKQEIPDPLTALNLLETNVADGQEGGGEEDRDEFGKFETTDTLVDTEADTKDAPVLQGTEGIVLTVEGNDSDDFDDFGDFEAAHVETDDQSPAIDVADATGSGESPEAAGNLPAEDDGWVVGIEKAEIAAVAPSPVIGAMGAAATEVEEEPTSIEEKVVSTGDSDFEDFGDFEKADTKDDKPSHAVASEGAGDIFGDFGSAGVASSTEAPAMDMGEKETESAEGHGSQNGGDGGEQNIATAEDDGFGDFGGFEAAAVTSDTEAPAMDVVEKETESTKAFGSLNTNAEGGHEIVETDDGFGDFGGFEAAALTSDTEAPATDVVEKETESTKAFGNLNTNAEGKHETVETEDDDFGDFDGFEAAALTSDTEAPATDVVEKETESTKAFGASDIDAGGKKVMLDTEDDDFGDFGDFEAAGATSDTDAHVADEFATEKEPDEAGGGPTKINAGEEQDDSFGDFGGFEAAEAALGAQETSSLPEPTSDLFSFSAESSEDVEKATSPGESTETEPEEKESNPSSDDGAEKTGFDVPKDPETSDDFGDFATFESSAVETAEGAELTQVQSDDFGDFAKVDSPEAAATTADADFGGFEFAAFEEAKEVSLEEMREKILASSSLLHETIRAVDVVKSFETSDGNGWSDLEEKYKTDAGSASQDLDRARRSFNLHTLLTSTHTQHALHWKQIMTIARDELGLSIFLMEEAKELSSGEQRHVSQSLQVMVSGLGEYVRLVRLVVATVADLLGLDPDALLTEHNIRSSWQSIDLMEVALEVETLWEKICQYANDMELTVNSVESIVDIRARAAKHGFADPLCELTLQPVSSEDKGTTKSQVVWDGKNFTACAANFWSHKVSMTVPC